MEQVTFTSNGVSCSAYLGWPDGPEPSHGFPAVVLGHGFGICKESLLIESEYFRANGMVTLAVDYTSFGDSEGEPRGSVFPLNHVEDFRNGISFLQRRDDVDPQRIGLWGASFGGGIALYCAAVDRRVRTVVAVAPIVNGRRWLHSLWGGAKFEELLAAVEADRQRRYDTGEGGRIPTASGHSFAALPRDERTAGANARAQEELGRPSLARTPDITLQSVEKVIEFFPDAYIHLISPRSLCIITPGGWDVFHPFDQIREAFSRAVDPKRIIPLPCNQMDVYLPKWQNIGLNHAMAWYREHLVQAAIPDQPF